MKFCAMGAVANPAIISQVWWIASMNKRSEEGQQVKDFGQAESIHREFSWLSRQNALSNASNARARSSPFFPSASSSCNGLRLPGNGNRAQLSHTNFPMQSRSCMDTSAALAMDMLPPFAPRDLFGASDILNGAVNINININAYYILFFGTWSGVEVLDITNGLKILA